LPDAKAIIKYALLHVIELGAVVLALVLVRHYFALPSWLMATILVLWILKDIALFPKVRRAYAVDDNRPVKQLMGLEATVTTGLDPVGYVRVRGELWRAEISDPRFPAKKGEKTKVVDAKGMTLVVEKSERGRGSGRA